MKKLIVAILIIQLFHQFPNGSWIFGVSEPMVYGIAIDSNGNCAKFDGEERECAEYDRNLMVSLKQLTIE